MFKSPITRLRVLGILEGVSFLVLLAIAMPLKYLADNPMPVKVVGWIHGVLFVAFALAIGPAVTAARWPAARAGLILLSGLLPFGPFVLERRLKQVEQELDPPTGPAAEPPLA